MAEMVIHHQIVNNVSNEMPKVPFGTGDFGENGRNGD